MNLACWDGCYYCLSNGFHGLAFQWIFSLLYQSQSEKPTDASIKYLWLKNYWNIHDVFMKYHQIQILLMGIRYTQTFAILNKQVRKTRPRLLWKGAKPWWTSLSGNGETVVMGEWWVKNVWLFLAKLLFWIEAPKISAHSVKPKQRCENLSHHLPWLKDRSKCSSVWKRQGIYICICFSFNFSIWQY